MSYITTFITITLFYMFYYSVKYFDNRIKYKSREFYNFIIMLPNSILVTKLYCIVIKLNIQFYICQISFDYLKILF